MASSAFRPALDYAAILPKTKKPKPKPKPEGGGKKEPKPVPLPGYRIRQGLDAPTHWGGKGFTLGVSWDETGRPGMPPILVPPKGARR